MRFLHAYAYHFLFHPPTRTQNSSFLVRRTNHWKESFQKDGGNVHDKGIVTITSTSVHEDDSKWAVWNIDDHFIYRYAFWSEDEPGQWIC
jgi:hypothetical protein